MRTMTASAAQQAFAGLLDQATHEPVVIQQAERESLILFPLAEYERMTHQIATAKFLHFCAEAGQEAEANGMTDAVLAELLADD